MKFPFIGPSNSVRSSSVDVERSINLYPEIEEVPGGNPKVKLSLIGCPGKTLFGTAPKAPFRGATVVRWASRAFYVAYDTLYELNSDGSSTSRGTLKTWTGYISMSSNPSQLMIGDGNNGYVLNLSTNVFLVVATLTTATGFIGASILCYIDGYFIANQPNTNNFAISALLDGTSWDGLDHAQKEGQADNIVSFIDIHREILFLGQNTSEIWFDSGAITFPWTPIQGIFIEKGCCSPFATVKADNTAFWMSADDRGNLQYNRLKGYTPERVSTHAIELQLKKMGDPTLFTAYSYQDEGHEFIVINSPTADTTVSYDCSTRMWHERQSLNPAGLRSRDRGNFHAFIFGQHLVFDFENSNIYALSLDVYTDNGNPLPAIRVGPHYTQDLKYIFYNSLQMDIETGVGLDGTGQGTTPLAILKQSNDGGKTWSDERHRAIGPIGATRARVRFTQLGRARDRVFWFEIDDPVKRNLVACLIDAEVGNN